MDSKSTAEPTPTNGQGNFEELDGGLTYEVLGNDEVTVRKTARSWCRDRPETKGTRSMGPGEERARGPAVRPRSFRQPPASVA